MSKKKLTKSRLRQLVREEVQNVISEDRMDEVNVNPSIATNLDDLYDMARNLKQSLDTLAADRGNRRLEKAAEKMHSIINIIREA